MQIMRHRTHTSYKEGVLRMARYVDADALLDRFEKESKAADEHGRDFSFCFMRGNEPCAEWWAVEKIVEDFAVAAQQFELVGHFSAQNMPPP